jgi:hypothetical protein
VIEDWSDELSTIVAARAAPLKIGARPERGEEAGEEALRRCAAGGDDFLDDKPLWSNVSWEQGTKRAREGEKPGKAVAGRVVVVCGQREAANDEMRRVTEK